MMMNDIDIHDIDNGDNGNYMMIYEAFPVSNNQFIVLFLKQVIYPFQNLIIPRLYPLQL